MTAALTSLETDLMAMKEAARDAIAAATTLDELEQLRIGYLGKKGQLSKVLGGMGKLSAEDRPRIGALANEVKELIQTQLDQGKTALILGQGWLKEKILSRCLEVVE